ncbi:MAG: polysaccharide pyruvyl transferase CsaB [Cyanobacteria bacterium HKST-UBA04]|nr:polysaccharide pyruvyl transferase CsaB [Cyanobacteria bacterium HKST-UBA04]
MTNLAQDTSPATAGKRILIGGYYGFENFGDELIAQVIIDHLRQYGAEPVLLSAEPQKTARQYGVEAVGRTDVKAIWHTMKHCHGFIIGGGGLFQDKTGPLSPVYYGGLMMMATVARRPIAFFAQGVGPLKRLLSQWILGFVINRANLIVVRDRASQEYLKTCTKKGVYLMADPGWLVGNLIPKTTDLTVPPKGIGVSLRPWPDLTSKAIGQVAETLMQIPGVQDHGVNLIDCHAGTDMAALARLEAHLKRLKVPYRWFHSHQVIEGILASELVVAMRFHALLVAAALSRPVVGLAYDPKVRYLMGQINGLCFEPDQWETLAQTVADDHNVQDWLKPDTLKGIIDLKRAAQQGFEQLDQWLNKL